MIAITPTLDDKLICPGCQSEAEANDVIFCGIHPMAVLECPNCQLQSFHVLPTGHAVDQSLTFNKEGEFLGQPDPKLNWLINLISNSFKDINHDEIRMERKVIRKCKEVVILNTLDYLYGHVLLKLLNAQFHLDHHRDLGLILIIPRSFQWMVPNGCAEVWIVDLKPGQMINWLEQLDILIRKELTRFNKVYLSFAYSHPDHTLIDIKRFTGITPFDIRNFYQQHPQITFVTREDRWWYENRLSYWLYRLGRKLKISERVGKLLALRQNLLIKQTIKLIKKEIPEIKVYVAGLGTSGNFRGVAIDNRVEKVDDQIEKEWCEIYRGSHLVIGFHGSNMLLPTAHAAGCIEILPSDREGNFVQDIAVRYADRMQLFLYRFLPQFVKPRILSQTITSIFKNFGDYHRSMCLQNYKPGD